MKSFFYRRQLETLERYGLGLPVGVAISICFDQLFLKSSISSFAWLIPLILTITFCRLKVSTDSIVKSVPTFSDLEMAVWLTIGVLAILGQEWFWPMPVSMFFAFAAAIWFKYIFANKDSRIRNQITIAFLVAGISALVFGLFIRPFSWWIEDSDFGFYEAFTVSLSRWGTSENLLSAGAGFRYHWFVYEWSGLVSKVASLPSWVMLTRGVVVIGAFSLASSIWSIIKRVNIGQRSTIFCLLIVCFFDSVTSWGAGFRIGFVSSPSQMIGFIWLFAILLVILDKDLQKISLSPLLFSILFSGAILSKVSHGVVALGGILMVLVFKLAKNRKLSGQQICDALSAVLVSLFWFFHTYVGAENARFNFLKFPEELIGSLNLWEREPLWFASFILLIGLVGFQFMGLVICTTNRKSRDSALYAFSLGSAIAGLLVTLSIQSLFGSQLYFLHSASSIILPTVAVISVESILKLTGEFKSNWRSNAIFGVGFISAAVSWAIPRLNSGSETAIWLAVSRSGMFVIPLFVAVPLVYSSPANKLLMRYGALCLVGLLGMSVGFSVTNWAMVLKREYPSFDRNENFNLGPKNLNLAMEWMKENTSDDIIFASNNESFLLPALSHRRGMLQAEEYIRRHTVLDENWNNELVKRRALVDRAFKSFNSGDLIEFKNFGVSILVFDKSVPNFTLPILPTEFSKIYENPSFLIIALSR